MKILKFGLLLFVISCASHQSRNKIFEGEVILKGGNLGDKSWDDDLVLKRVGWFKDASLKHEMLYTKMTKDSPFTAWLGGRKISLSTCENFFIVFLYSDINAENSNALIINELKQAGLEQKEVLDFTYHIRAHQNFLDWKLLDHKVLGFCQNKTLSQPITINVPGHKSYKLL